MNVIATIRLIQVDGRNSSVELDAHNKKGQFVGTRKSYDPAVIEKVIDLIEMFHWENGEEALLKAPPFIPITRSQIEVTQL